MVQVMESVGSVGVDFEKMFVETVGIMFSFYVTLGPLTSKKGQIWPFLQIFGPNEKQGAINPLNSPHFGPSGAIAPQKGL